MCENILKRVNAGLRFLYRKQGFLGFKERKMLYMSFLQPFLDYSCISWYSGLAKNYKHKLQTAQNKAIRFVLKLDSRCHLTQLHFSRLSWLNVKHRVDFLAMNLMFKIYYGTAPLYMANQNLVRDVHGYNTRSNDMSYVIPHVKTNGLSSFRYLGTNLWNSLPNSIKQIQNHSMFKVQCKKHLIASMLNQESSQFVYY